MAPSTASFRGEVRQLLRPYYIVNIVLCLSFIVLKEGGHLSIPFPFYRFGLMPDYAMKHGIAVSVINEEGQRENWSIRSIHGVTVLHSFNFCLFNVTLLDSPDNISFLKRIFSEGTAT